MLKGSVISSCKILACKPWLKIRIVLTIFIGIAWRRKIFQSTYRSTESKAFSKSTKNRNSKLFYSKVASR